MKQKLINSIAERLNTEIAPQNPVKFLRELPMEDLIDQSISIVYLYTRVGKGANKSTILMSEIISAIGHSLRNKGKLKRDSAISAKAGAFVLYSFELLGLLSVKKGRAANGHATYIVDVVNDEALVALWGTVEQKKTEKLPSLTPYLPWTTPKHDTGMPLVKTQNKDVLEELTIERCPLVYEMINKAQEVGWRVNKDIFPIYSWALRNKTDAFASIWDLQNPEARASKIREVKAVGEIAGRFLDETFYHLYYLDFRARKYPATAYFHEQGTDLSKGLLLLDEPVKIGEQGYFWLLISIASNWAGDAGREDQSKTDKIPLNDRVYWALDNEEILLSYAKDPKVNQGWMQADKPWQFLAGCNEFLKLRKWQEDTKALASALHSRDVIGTAFTKPKSYKWDEYGYKSSLIVYIDGSNNGSQHLSALTRDEVTAPHVNLVPLELPGDLYKYVSDHVWEEIDKAVALLSKKEKKQCDNVIDTLTDIKGQIHEAPMKSERRRSLLDSIKPFREDEEETIKMAAPVFWSRIKDAKHRRKVVKRGVMTLPFGGSAYGLGQQVIDDSRKHGIAQLMTMENRWGSYMGRLIFEVCRSSLERPMRLLRIFEEAGKKAEKEGRFLSWHVPITGFPVVQHYTEGRVKKTWVQYGPPEGERNSSGYYDNTLQLHICFIEISTPSKRKQAQGASPNAIHSLDAAHLTLTVCHADFPMVTVHDSFGCALGDMSELFILIRETFVELYASDPLTLMMKEMGGNSESVEIGTLDIHDITDSEYAFV